MKSISMFVFIILLFQSGISAEFGEEIQITDSINGLEFSRSTQNMMHVTSDGIIHLVYTYPDKSIPVPNTSIYYQTIENGVPSKHEKINSGSTTALNPAMIIGNDGTVHVVWHDSRHSTAAGNWIDNTEIYYDKKIPGGTFMDSDIRITQTTASHLGDNGYAPQLAIRQDGRLILTWYDFHRNGKNADVYMRLSNENGSFPLQEGIDEFQITNIDSESGNDEFTSNWIPTITPYGEGMYLLWGFQDGFTSLFNLKGISINENISMGDVDLLGIGGKYLDPAKLATDSNGNIGCVYTTIINNQNVIVFRYRKINEAWSEPTIINQGASHATQPHLAFDSTRNAHLVWQEDLGGIFEIHYAVIDTENHHILSEQTVSSFDADARTPVIAIQPVTDRITIAWFDRRNTPLSAVYMVQEMVTTIQRWNLY